MRQQSAQFAAWPFLIGRAAVQPIQVVAAPRSMCDAQVYGILHRLTAHENHFTSFGHAFWREWRRTDPSSMFHLLVTFQVIQATERFIGGDTDRPLLDRNGRPIDLVEGFACDQMESALFLPGRVLLEVHQRVIEHYREFWHADFEQPYQVVPLPPLMTEPPITSDKGVTEGVVVLHQLDPFVSDTPVFEGLHFVPTPANETLRPTSAATKATPPQNSSAPNTPSTDDALRPAAEESHEPPAPPRDNDASGQRSRRQRRGLLGWRH